METVNIKLYIEPREYTHDGLCSYSGYEEIKDAKLNSGYTLKDFCGELDIDHKLEKCAESYKATFYYDNELKCELVKDIFLKEGKTLIDFIKELNLEEMILERIHGGY